MPEEVNVGDVVVAQSIVSDVLGKHHEDGSRTVRWTPYEVDESLRDSALNFRDGWQKLITVEPPEPVTTRRVATAFISGGNVVASPQLAKQYAATWDGKASAIEMEAAGVAEALRGFKKRPAFFMIRGISDPVTSSSNQEIKELSALPQIVTELMVKGPAAIRRPAADARPMVCAAERDARRAVSGRMT